MSNNCPFCDSAVDQYGLQCDKCASWVHYSCTKLPPYMIIQLSKSKRVFSCHSCVHAKYLTDFPELHTKIESVIKAHSESLISNLDIDDTPTTNPLPPPTPPPLPDSLIVITPPPTKKPAKNKPTLMSKPKDTIDPTDRTKETKPPCRFYLKGSCKHGKKGPLCKFPHPPMCFKYIHKGSRGCNKGENCKYTHPKLCKSSVEHKSCDRINCFYYHIVGTSRPNINREHSQMLTPPTPLMNIKLPNKELYSKELYSKVTAQQQPRAQPIDLNTSPQQKVNESNAFLDQLRDLKNQMSQIQQTQSILLQNLLSQNWPPLAKQKQTFLPSQMMMPQM